MVKDAEQLADEDKKRRAAAEAKNNAESLIHTTERQLEEHGDKIDDALKGEIQTAVDEATKAVEGGDSHARTKKSQAHAQVTMKPGQHIYKKDQPDAGSQEDSATQGVHGRAPRRERGCEDA